VLVRVEAARDVSSRRFPDPLIGKTCEGGVPLLVVAHESAAWVVAVAADLFESGFVAVIGIDTERFPVVGRLVPDVQ
jgi:hypothetical protein